MKKCIFLIAVFLVLPLSVKASVLRLHGHAWSSNIGWISFNSEDSGGSSLGTYAVKLDTATGYFSGHAWSSNIGWISFDRTETGAPPQDDACEETDCLARVDSVSDIGAGYVSVEGWARALSAISGDGSWDGWIKFDHGLANEARLDSRLSTEPWMLTGYAWGDNKIGWISFDYGNQVKVYLDDCDCTSYSISDCGDGSCSATQTRNVRTCDPSGCAIEALDCTNNTSCYHNTCNVYSCLTVEGSGEDECTYDYDCYHKECNASYPYDCISVSGVGSDSCSNDNQCRHKECLSSTQCDYASGSGSDGCNNDGDCCVCSGWYWSDCGYGECDDDEQKQIRDCPDNCDTEEMSFCSYSDDCFYAQFHTECNPDTLQCELIPGPVGGGVINECGDPSNPNDDYCQPILWDWWEVIARQFKD